MTARPDFFGDDSADWRSSYDPASTVANITRSYNGFRFGIRGSGSSVRIVPRGRGSPVYVIDIDAESQDGGSQIHTVVRPATRAVARATAISAVVAAVGLVLTIAHVQIQIAWLTPGVLILFGGLGTVVFGAQLLSMGVVRRAASARLATAMSAAGAVAVSVPSSPDG
jgi:voltage-gated potassium channel Kch